MARKTKNYTKELISKEIISIIETERSNWEDAICWVTDKVGIKMRDAIREYRKNYWGIFDKEKDSITGSEKVWVPMVMSVVEDIAKNVDMDAKDIGYRAKTPAGIPITEFTRLATKEELYKMGIGETLDHDQRSLLIDGTVVWKTWKGYKKSKTAVNRKTIDLLNFYIDPTEESIQKAYRVTERSLMLPAEIQMMDWENTDDLTGSETLSRNDADERSATGTRSTANYRDVWEMWGKIPKWTITGRPDDEDANEEIDGHAIISGLDSGKPALHLVEENKNVDETGCAVKPYEEWWATKVSGRWYGLGIPERVMALQMWLNRTINMRLTKTSVSQLGLFRIRKGQGITSAMLKKLPVNGAIEVNNPEDITQMPVSDVAVSSYKDEESIMGYVTKVTQAYPIASGEILPSSTTATAASIASTSAKSAYVLIKEQTGHFLTRWIERHFKPILAEKIKIGDIIRITNDDDKFKEIVENIISYRAIKALKDYTVEDLDGFAVEYENAIEKMKKSPEIFVKSLTEIIANGVESYVRITNEDLDTNASVANILQLIPIMPEYREALGKQIFDLLGLTFPTQKQQPQQIETQAMTPTEAVV
jgi:hypothetical protein